MKTNNSQTNYNLPFGHNDNHYSNILLQAPDGQPLARISKRKAEKFYLKNNLAEYINDPSSEFPVLKLKFEPKGRRKWEPLLQVLNNKCVVCGIESGLSQHHVIPLWIKKHMSDDHKNHTHTWCVLLCDYHHAEAEKIIRLIVPNTIAVTHGKLALIAIKESKENYRNALWYMKYKNDISKIPNEKIQLFMDRAGVFSLDEIKLEERRSNVKLIKQISKETNKEYALNFIEEHGGCDNVKKIFKDAFLKLEPKFLPDGFLEDYAI